MKITPDGLRLHPLLALLPYSALKRLVTGSAVSEYPKGTVLFREGDACEAIYLIISGRCEASVRDRHGESVVEEVFGPGDTMGERAFLNGERHRRTATVATHCVLLRIPAEELEGIFTKDPKLAGRFSHTVRRRLRVLGERVPGRGARVRRVVSLVAFAPRVNVGLVAARLAKSLRRITGQKVLLLKLAADPYAGRPHPWVLREMRFDQGEFGFARELRAGEDGEYDVLRLPVGTDRRDAEAIAPLVSDCGRHYDYVLVEAASDLPDRIVTECLVQADLAYVVLQPSMQCLYDYELLTRALAETTPAATAHVKPIVVIEEPMEAEQFHDTFKRFGHAVHSFARGFPASGAGSTADRRFDLHVNRLAREIARCRVGLALSSGGAKGYAHAGVIQVLEENGIEIDAIAGASMGAYVGSLWAYGFDGEALERIAIEMEGRQGLWSILDPVLPPRRGFVRTRRVANRLRRSLGDAHFSDLVRPLRVVAAHLPTLERVVFSTGDVVCAVEASIAMPGICVPVEIDGEPYVDGGISDPLPVDVLHEMGIERIIAVNAIPTPEKLRYWLEREREMQCGQACKPRRSIGRFLNEHLNYFAPGNVFDTMVQALNSVQMRVADAQTAHADVVLRPVAVDALWHDFGNPRKYLALGREVAEAQLDELLALAHGSPSDEHPHPPLPAKKPLAFPAALRAA
jgi:NTE family protein